MSEGWKKAEVRMAHAKIGIYGGPGSGKTNTALLGACILAKDVYVFDTERGTEPFAADYNFNVKYTRSIASMIEDIPNLPANCCVIFDQITHVWDGVQDAYIEAERRKPKSAVIDAIEKNASLPWTSWRFIKPPYHRLINACLYSPIHAIIVARMNTEYKVGPNNEPIKVGEKMDAEKDTAHEPHILIKMVRENKKHYGVVEKARGVFKEWQGQMIETVANDYKPFVEFFEDIKKKLNPTAEGGGVEMPGDGDVAMFPGETKANDGQLKIMSVLANKANIPLDIVSRVLENVGATKAQELINQMSKGRFEEFKALGSA